jgi:hypothetical protein
MNLQEALAEALGKKPIPSKKEEQGGKTSEQTHQAHEHLTTQQRVAREVVRRSEAARS